jgi:GNAT superfamily N-acetyltransferase
MLADTPIAYITTYAEAEAYPDELWMERCTLGATSDEQSTYLGVAGDEVVAMGVGLRRPQRQRNRKVDVLVIVSVFVEAAYRGTGVADRLMAAIEEWGRSWGAPTVTLWVTETNDRAAAFYRRIGFGDTGDRTRMGPTSDLFEIRLEKPL